MHPERKAAEKKYQAAVAAMNSYNGLSESEYDALCAIVAEHRKIVIALEEKYPTKDEIRREREYRYLASRGLG